MSVCLHRYLAPLAALLLCRPCIRASGLGTWWALDLVGVSTDASGLGVVLAIGLCAACLCALSAWILCEFFSKLTCGLPVNLWLWLCFRCRLGLDVHHCDAASSTDSCRRRVPRPCVEDRTRSPAQEMAREALREATPLIAPTLSESRGLPVCLHIYDVGKNKHIQQLNEILNFTPLRLGGVFHAGVEVVGLEWSFGYTERGSGVSATLPRKHPMHRYKETVQMPRAHLSKEQLLRVVRAMVEDYPGCGYDVLGRNCCSFADELCHRLGVGEIPGWIHRFAQIGNSVASAFEQLETNVNCLASQLTL